MTEVVKVAPDERARQVTNSAQIKAAGGVERSGVESVCPRR